MTSIEYLIIGIFLFIIGIITAIYIPYHDDLRETDFAATFTVSIIFTLLGLGMIIAYFF